MEYARLCLSCKENCKQEKHVKIITCKDYTPKNGVIKPLKVVNKTDKVDNKRQKG